MIDFSTLKQVNFITLTFKHFNYLIRITLNCMKLQVMSIKFTTCLLITIAVKSIRSKEIIIRVKRLDLF